LARNRPPNTNGYRSDVIAALKVSRCRDALAGRCFADEYHWRDGSVTTQAPREVNTHWGGVAETNEFGTHEFMAFAEMIGTKVGISGNVHSAVRK
jgi:alpha-N-arabinofuranosidase